MTTKYIVRVPQKMDETLESIGKKHFPNFSNTNQLVNAVLESFIKNYSESK